MTAIKEMDAPELLEVMAKREKSARRREERIAFLTEQLCAMAEYLMETEKKLK